MQKVFLIALLCVSTFGVFAQTTDEKKWIEKAKSFKEAEDYRASLNSYLKALKLNPKNEETIYQIAWLYNDLEVYDTAIIYVNKGLLLDSKDERLYNESGYAYRKKEVTKMQLANMKLLTV